MVLTHPRDNYCKCIFIIIPFCDVHNQSTYDCTCLCVKRQILIALEHKLCQSLTKETFYWISRCSLRDDSSFR